MEEERREKTRVYFHTQVVLTSGDSEIVAETNSKDISLKGMFVYTQKMMPIDTSCHIEIILRGSSSRLSLRMEGKVIRHDDSGLGITFDSIDIDSYFHLKNLVMYNAEDPDIIEEEVEA